MPFRIHVAFFTGTSNGIANGLDIVPGLDRGSGVVSEPSIQSSEGITVSTLIYELTMTSSHLQQRVLYHIHHLFLAGQDLEAFLHHTSCHRHGMGTRNIAIHLLAVCY